MNECVSHAWVEVSVVDVAAKYDVRTFSNGQPVDSVETEKSRIVLKELEQNWWILAVGRLSYRAYLNFLMRLTVYRSYPTAISNASPATEVD